jgi:hypothetical protein
LEERGMKIKDVVVKVPNRVQRVLVLFNGMGDGISSRLSKLGAFEAVGFCEENDFGRRLLHKRWPDAKIYKDLSKLARRCYDCEPEDEDGGVFCPRCEEDFADCACIGTDQLLDECGPIDVVVGGAKERDSDSMLEFSRIVRELEPRMAVMLMGYDGEIEGIGMLSALVLEVMVNTMIDNDEREQSMRVEHEQGSA